MTMSVDTGSPAGASNASSFSATATTAALGATRSVYGKIVTCLVLCGLYTLPAFGKTTACLVLQYVGCMLLKVVHDISGPCAHVSS